MHKRTVAAIVALSMVLSFNVRVSAEPSLQDKLTKSQGDVTAAQKKLGDLESKIDSLDQQIAKTNSDIASYKNQISEKESEITQTEADIKKAEDDIKAEQELYNKRMRAMYISGNQGYISIVLDSSNLNDFMSKVETVQRISAFDKNIIQSLNDKRQKIQEKKTTLDNDKQKLVDLQSKSQGSLDSLNKQKAEQEPLIAQANADEAAAIASNSAVQAEINAANQRAQEEKSNPKPTSTPTPKPTPTPTPTPTPANGKVSGNDIVNYAEKFLGVPYVWGGESPSGFDCSGLVQYVYGKFGMQLDRTSQDQYNDGYEVSTSDLQPGDLLFFAGSDGTSKAPGHVAIYVGNGTMIEAPHTGANVRIIGIYGGLVGARRIIK